MTSETDHKQYLFGQYCKQGDIVKVKKAYGEGAKLEAVFLGIAAAFPTDMTVFNWLLEMNCPVDGNTWLYVSSADNSDVRTKEIYEKTKCDLKFAGIHAARDLNQPMLTYVVTQTGWLPEYPNNVSPKETYSDFGQLKHQEFVRWVISQNKK